MRIVILFKGKLFVSVEAKKIIPLSNGIMIMLIKLTLKLSGSQLASFIYSII